MDVLDKSKISNKTYPGDTKYEEKEKNERYWNLLTLAPLRQRVFGNANNQIAERNVSN